MVPHGFWVCHIFSTCLIAFVVLRLLDSFCLPWFSAYLVQGFLDCSAIVRRVARFFFGNFGVLRFVCKDKTKKRWLLGRERAGKGKEIETLRALWLSRYTSHVFPFLPLLSSSVMHFACILLICHTSCRLNCLGFAEASWSWTKPKTPRKENESAPCCAPFLISADRKNVLVTKLMTHIEQHVHKTIPVQGVYFSKGQDKLQTSCKDPTDKPLTRGAASMPRRNPWVIVGFSFFLMVKSCFGFCKMWMVLFRKDHEDVLLSHSCMHATVLDISKGLPLQHPPVASWASVFFFWVALWFIGRCPALVQCLVECLFFFWWLCGWLKRN